MPNSEGCAGSYRSDNSCPGFAAPPTGIPPVWPTLRDDEVHVWCAALDLDSAAAEADVKILSEEELQRAARFAHPLDCQRFIQTRIILKSLLGRYLDVTAASISITRGRFGKPALCRSDMHGSLHFNLSYSHGLALCAVSRSFAVGIDIELIRPQLESLSLAEYYLPPADVSRLHELLPEERAPEFFRAWTRMEARQKVSGEGLRPVESAVNFDKATCSAENLSVHDSYSAALAVDGAGYTVRTMDWLTWRADSLTFVDSEHKKDPA